MILSGIGVYVCLNGINFPYDENDRDLNKISLTQLSGADFIEMENLFQKTEPKNKKNIDTVEENNNNEEEKQSSPN